jgi:hypothetical protein
MFGGPSDVGYGYGYGGDGVSYAASRRAGGRGFWEDDVVYGHGGARQFMEEEWW